MSENDDDLFARWSRRKRAARSRDIRSPEEETPAASTPAAEADVHRPLTPAGPAVEPPEPLPSLEDITADGDLSEFLRGGIPTTLKNAAMRKMWSLDPAIRDHVGLAEYAWDFNQSGAMPGFGPLEAGKSVADFLSTAGREMPSQPEKPAPEAPEPPEQPIGLFPDEALTGPARPAVIPEVSRQSATEVPVDPASAEAADRADCGPASRPRHGGALPR